MGVVTGQSSEIEVTSATTEAINPGTAGKNRALDDDELEFIAGVEGAKAAREAAWEDEQNRELDAFREVTCRGISVCYLLSQLYSRNKCLPSFRPHSNIKDVNRVISSILSSF